jgi:hypothetical protein
MSIHLEDNAVKVFKNIIDSNHDNIITPDEAAQGININILKPISDIHPGIGRDDLLNPRNLNEFLNDYGAIDDVALKVLLEQYLDFLANKTTNPSHNKRIFQNQFNTTYLPPQNASVSDADVEMDVDEPTVDTSHNEEEEDLQRALALSLETPTSTATTTNATTNTAPTRRRTLNEINQLIQVFNPIDNADQPANVFLEDQSDYQPFIIRISNGQFNGDAIDWPASSSVGKEFVECRDDAPSKWQANNYKKWIKPNARRFIKMYVYGLTLVIKPSWYDSGIVPGTKYFHLVPAGTVNKFMSKTLSTEQLPDDFSALGADHCNQTSPVGTYELREITLEELNTMVPAGGRTNTRKQHKQKQYKQKQRTRKQNRNQRKHKKSRKSKKPRKLRK